MLCLFVLKLYDACMKIVIIESLDAVSAYREKASGYKVLLLEGILLNKFYFFCRDVWSHSILECK